MILSTLLPNSAVYAADETWITGRVVSSSGVSPIGTLVKADPLSGPGSNGSALADVNGRFTITVFNVSSTTTYKVYPPPEGFATPASVTIALNKGQTKDVGTFTIP